MGLIRWLRSVGFLPASIELTKEDKAPQPSNPASPPFPEGWGPPQPSAKARTPNRRFDVSPSQGACVGPLWLQSPTTRSMATRLRGQVQGETVAYLSRTDAKRYQSRLRTLTEPLRVPAKLIGGTGDKPSFGGTVDCRELEAMPKPKATRKKRPAADPADQPF